ncbi:hypothetical protein EW138_00885 (plasmid) [Klebsiella pneumoniae]|nr:hypothetical protein EW138_00885 [Klebsiella pneumoniae]
MFAGKKSAQIREILISESAWEEMTCLFAPSLDLFTVAVWFFMVIMMGFVKKQLFTPLVSLVLER